MNRNLIAKFVAVIGSAAVIVHLVIFAIYRYDTILFFIILGLIYLTVPLMKKIKSSEPR
ncbi:hypothetical protein KY328_00875 [Candidatus Woesearchaeota archaeon]|nr:hypothetical protein [Candidatus Woesearchaeota archaeon]MBW3021449.1 hypothetical protein [Candidatus Woesearchaeota archaeon]